MPICLAGLKGTIVRPPRRKTAGVQQACRRQNNLPLTPADKVSGYNNFYEFGLDKADPAANAGSLKTDPWTLKISGEVAKPLTLDHDDLTRRFPLEERIYRMRCVEAWSMVVPWIGFRYTNCWRLPNPPAMRSMSLSKRFMRRNRCRPAGPLYRRRAEISLCRRIASRRSNASAHTDDRRCLWQALPPQNGAPVRLIVPWKYGFKGIKSIVSIKLTRERPPTTRNLAAPDEYGFTPTLIRMLITRAGHRLPNDLLVQAAFSMFSASQHYCLMVTPTGGIAVSWPGFAGEFLNASDSKTGDMAESLPASCRIVAVSLAGLGDQSRWTGCRSGERYSAFYRSHCTEILLAALLITPLARYAKQPLLIRTRRLLGLWCFAGRHCI